MRTALARPTAQRYGYLLQPHRLILVLMLVAALGIRLDHINEPPLNFHATRQYRSLIIARGFYRESNPSLPTWETEVARVSKERQGMLEPPIMELAVAAGYHLVGHEALWIPKLLSSLFWLTGAVFLFCVGARLTGVDAAVVSAAFYLFLPFAITASRSFQPDPLMVMLLLASLYALIRYAEQPSKRRLGLVAALAAPAAFVKPVSLFVILGAFVALQIWRLGPRGAAVNRHSVAFAGAILLPVVTFYVYGTVVAGFLREQAQASFLPQLLLNPFFWRGWIRNIHTVAGLPVLILALLGSTLFRPGLPRAVIAGLWIGYAAVCLVFSYHVATHDYYHLPLIPIVALAVGPAVALVIRRVLDQYRHWYWRTALASLALLALLLNLDAVQAQLRHPNGDSQVRAAEEVGQLVDHSTNTVYLSGDYGLSLEYHGELSGRPWPLVSDLEWERLAGVSVLGAQERFTAWFAPHGPNYFIVMDLPEFQKQQDLRTFLTDNYPALAQTSHYVIFDLRAVGQHRQPPTDGAEP